MSETAHTLVKGLLGAWAVDACSSGEAELVEAHLASCESCGAEAKRMLEGAAMLGEKVTGEEPPFSLRSKVLDMARLQKRSFNSRPATVPPREAYEAEVEALDAILVHLSESEWLTRTVNEWTVKETVIHMTVLDGAVVREQDIAPSDVHPRTVQAIHERGEEPGEQLRLVWRLQASKVSQRLSNAGSSVYERTWHLLGLSLTMGQIAADRAFETWLHGQDIRKALALPETRPKPEHLALLTDYGARMVPIVSRTIDGLHPICARLVLTGAGGGAWLLPLGAGIPQSPDTTVVMDAVEFCYLLGGRRQASSVTRQIEGDREAGERFLQVAGTLARL